MLEYSVGQSVFEIKVNDDLSSGSLFKVTEYVIGSFSQGALINYKLNDQSGELKAEVLEHLMDSDIYSPFDISFGDKFYVSSFDKIEPTLQKIWSLLQKNMEFATKYINAEVKRLDLSAGDYLEAKSIDIQDILEQYDFLIEHITTLSGVGKPSLELSFGLEWGKPALFDIRPVTLDLYPREFFDDLEVAEEELHEVLDVRCLENLKSELESDRDKSVVISYVYESYSEEYEVIEPFTVKTLPNGLLSSDVSPESVRFLSLKAYIQVEDSMSESLLLEESSKFIEMINKLLRPNLFAFNPFAEVLQKDFDYSFVEQYYFE